MELPISRKVTILLPNCISSKQNSYFNQRKRKFSSHFVLWIFYMNFSLKLLKSMSKPDLILVSLLYIITHLFSFTSFCKIRVKESFLKVLIINSMMGWSLFLLVRGKMIVSNAFKCWNFQQRATEKMRGYMLNWLSNIIPIRWMCVCV